MMRLYKFKSHPNYDFYTCCSGNNEQYLLGFDEMDFLVLKFSSEGAFREITKEGKVDQNTLGMFDSLATEWISNHQLQMDTIAVKKFSIPSYGIQISDLPDILEEYLQNKANFSDEEKEEFERQIDLWRDNQSYVFDWAGFNVWVDQEGEITAT